LFAGRRHRQSDDGRRHRRAGTPTSQTRRAFIEFLLGEVAQQYFTGTVYEFPVIPARDHAGYRHGRELM
jgi:hypothetical protein